MENKWGAACSNPCSAPSSAAQALPPITLDTVNAANHRNWKNLLIVCLLPLLVPTPVNTGKGIHSLYLTVLIVDSPLYFGKPKTRHAHKLYTFVHNLERNLDARYNINKIFSPSTKKLPGIHPGSLQAELKGRYLAAEIIWMWYTSLPSAALRPVA